MPEDWKVGKLGDFIEIKRGGSPRPIQEYLAPNGLNWLKISDATAETSPYILEIKEHIKPEGLNKTVFLKKGSLVLSNSATPGIPKFLDIDTCIHDGWLYFPSSLFSNEYLFLLFNHIRKDLISLGNGSVFTNLKTDILRNFKAILPTKEVIQRFDSIVSSIFISIKRSREEIATLTNLRDALLPKLMSGEIDVSNVDISALTSTDKLSFRCRSPPKNISYRFSCYFPLGSVFCGNLSHSSLLKISWLSVSILRMYSSKTAEVWCSSVPSSAAIKAS